MNSFESSLRPLFLGASLLANVALAYLLVRSAPTPVPIAPRAGEPTTIPATAVAGDSPPPLEYVASSSWWNSLDCEDAAELVTRLRAAGFPERLVRGILWERLETDRNQATAPPSQLPYWQRLNHPQDPASAAKRRQASEFMRAELVRALGGQPYDLPYPGLFEVRSAMHGLSPDSALKRHWLGDASIQRQREWENALPPDCDSSARQAMFAELEKEETADLRAALPSAEFDAYTQRNAPKMRPLLSRSAGLDLSLEEYTTLLDLTRSSPTSLSDPALKAQIAAALGPERAADFEQAVRGSPKTNRLLDRLGLPLRIAPTLDAVRGDIRSRAAAVRQDPVLDSAAQQSQLAALAAEARLRLTAALTPTGYDAYYDYLGEWLDEITGAPPAAVTPPPPP